MNGELLTAVQLQPFAAVAMMVLELPAALKVLPEGEIETVQLFVTPFWVTVKVCPAMVMVPARKAPLLAATA